MRFARATGIAFAAAVAFSARAQAEERPAWSVYTRSGASVYVSSARTIGGAGGALGVRFNGAGSFITQAEVGALTGLGTVFEFRVAAGLQRSGRWSPAVLATLSALVGDQTSFLSDRRPLPVRGPAVTAGLDVQPLRFVFGSVVMSSLQVGAGVGTDFPGLGVNLRLGFFELTVGF